MRSGAAPRLLGLAAAALFLISSPARAEERDLFERFSPDFEFFGVRNVDGPGQDSFSIGGGGAVHVELNLVKSFGIHLGGQLLVLGPGDIDSTVFFFGSQVGARFHWSAWIEALPGDAWVEVHHVFGRSLLSFGASLSLMARERLGEEIPDEDNDGVPDWDDMCPDQATGRHADPQNEGCPARDRDGDAAGAAPRIQGRCGHRSAPLDLRGCDGGSSSLLLPCQGHGSLAHGHAGRRSTGQVGRGRRR